MDSLYLLIPLSVILALAIAGLLVWAAVSGQFEQLDEVGDRVLREQPDIADDHEPGPSGGTEQSR
jgi:cbb3-type cytochrome oxidase maturation protein